ncbi:protein disulfide isomerase pTAC5, chloroplastic isoform X2 [Cornus florida]|uniref:protein disulfide isomerase pTAC5, chloroplastic isoform X2 n=1 Tax=Cornus florida TaxID=4283 RepID=UPI00289DE2D0|nr:protein disulfide isomerase pTAC5, chloroplastic isoform X2 [Cornus florida]
MSSSIPLSFNLHPFYRRIPSDPNLTPFPISKSSFNSLSKSHFCFSLSSSDSSNYEREESRWLREEQRWLREEQRWLRQESRWDAERESLLREISALKHRIQELQRHDSIQGSSASETVSNIAAMLQALKKTEADVVKKVNRIAESGSSAVPLVVEAAENGVVEEEVVVKEVVRVSETERKEKKEVKNRATLRKGSEGDDVRAMQEALQKLGFYSGEEDMEFSSFSSGTDRAVKTWQATLGAPEDGIMTAALLERLYMEQQIVQSGLTVNTDPKENTNGAAFASVTELSEIQQMVVKEDGVAEVDLSERKVYLLGENRWEDPSRLTGGNKQVGGVKSKDATTKCLSCRGEGRLLCTVLLQNVTGLVSQILNHSLWNG